LYFFRILRINKSKIKFLLCNIKKDRSLDSAKVSAKVYKSKSEVTQCFSTGVPRNPGVPRASCSQIFPNSKSSNAVPPRLFIFRLYHLLPPLPLWRLLSKTISNAKCNFSIHPSAWLPRSKRCQRWSCHLDFALSKALQNTLSKYHFHIFRRKTARCLRKSTHLAIKNRSL